MAPHRYDPIQYEYSDGSTGSPVSEGAGTEPIAIVGIGCRLPGGINSSSKLWEALEKGRSGQCGVPSSRFNVDAFYHPKGVDRPGSMNTKGGYFLDEDVRMFDNEFFGINPMEATYMDPQQRKLLEVVFESLESAGSSLEDISGSNTGCYVGNFTVDFQVMQTRDSEYLHRYSATGMGTTILGNRISHAFNLKGPSLVLDTACSSSLYCLHVACTALNNGECDAAIVAGANLVQSPEQHLGTMKAGVLSGTSTCHTFSDEADGYGRADGIGSLYIKRLGDAIRNNNPIRAVIRGTAINSNGKTPGITLPSALGQEAVIHKAYTKAGLDVDRTAYVECHGTGTPVGDPIEVEAVSRSFNTPGKRPLLIGSVKTNLGHSEAASGISSVIKTTLALEKAQIPATIGVKRVNPKIKTGEWNVEVVTKLTPWPTEVMGNGMSPEDDYVDLSIVSPSKSRVRRAGVNSFGYGGANAHAILENADAHLPLLRDSEVRTLGPRKTYLLPFSAASKESLDYRVTDLAAYISTTTVDIRDLAGTLGRRSKLSHRGFIVAKDNLKADVLSLDTLQTLSEEVSGSPSRRAFVFTGQGAQWPQMCSELILEFPIFRNAIMEMGDIIKSLPQPPTWTLLEALLEPASTSKIHDVTQSQPLCTAIQVALIQLLASWNITPDYVLGHSSGEIAAAYAAGLISSAEAITIAYYRGYVVGKYNMNGAMLAAGLGQEQADAEIQKAGLTESVRVACINSPESVTISGDEIAIDQLLLQLQNEKMFARKLNTGGRAYHSHHMAVIGEEYETLLDQALRSLGLSSSPPTTAKWISSVTGVLKTSDCSAAYWRSNLEGQVRFSQAVEQLSKEGDFQLIELGPHSALEMPIKQIRSGLKLTTEQLPYLTAISRGKDGVDCVLRLAGNLFLRGNTMHFDRINGLQGPGKQGSRLQYKVLHDLPPYRWKYDTLLWHESRASLDFRHRQYSRHELLGSQIPGGNGHEYWWRNIVRVSDISWLQDHKLEETVVFPGAGYVAMAIEAVGQATARKGGANPVYRLRHVHILTALVLSCEPTSETELFTTLQPTKITSASDSDLWWDFTITSFENGNATTHATGSISCQAVVRPLRQKYNVPESTLESTASRVWYEKLIKEGLNFGPAFQSILEFHVPRMRNTHHCTTKVPILQDTEPPTNGVDTPYTIHPITIDAMLQTAIVATSSGLVHSLRAKVPVTIDSAAIQAPNCKSGYIDSEANIVGFGAAQINAELRDDHGEVVVQLNNVRLAPYNTAGQAQLAEKRHPMLRVLWKPDPFGLGLMSSEAFDGYLSRFAHEAKSEISDEGLLKLGAALDMVVHKNPGLRILELGNDIFDITNATLDLLDVESSFKKVQTYSVGYIGDDGKLHAANVGFERENIKRPEQLPAISDQKFDIVLLPFAPTTDLYLATKLNSVKQIMSPDAVLLALSPSTDQLHSSENGFDAVQSIFSDGNGRVILATLTKESAIDFKHQNTVLITRGGTTPLSVALANRLAVVSGENPHLIQLDEVTDASVPVGSTVYALLETEKPLLSSVTDSEMAFVKVITNNASNLIWVTAGNLLEGGPPEMSLVSGLSRALMLEQPSLKFFCYDIDDADTHLTQRAISISNILSQSKTGMVDYEFIERNGVVHVSRFVPDSGLNDAFRQKQGSETVDMALSAARPAQLTIDSAGQFDSLYFKQTQLPEVLIGDQVQVQLKAVGLNAKDFYSLGGKVDTRDATCTLEYCGIVERVGPDVTSLKYGDRVVVMAPGHFSTSEVVPEWACQVLKPDEDFNVMSTLSVVYATALYALHHRARIQPGESVLIHSGAGGVGIAAIQIAQLAGAEIFTTVSTQAKRDFLINTFGIKPENIFQSRDASFLPDILAATNGRGVDVVLNSLVGDLLHASWRCCASFGRFIEIGKRDLTDAGRLEMEQFLKNVTFSAFDMSNLYYHENPAYRKIWADLIREVLELYRAKKIRKIEPLEVFDVTDLASALRRFSSGNRMGKIAVNLENQSSLMKTKPFQFKSVLSSTKSYIMIGCLGGLGRSMSKWMMARGARKFVFLGRSGIDKAPARRLVEDLEAKGATCSVVRGDVCDYDAVKRVVEQVDGQIGGVIQAAMGLNEALFTTMSNNYWHTGIDPKVIGTWNLHHAIQGKDSELDFFLMTSSVSGSVGTATESNYCAANHFLDQFARYRRSLGLPAMAVGFGMISEVGYLHENPEIEALLLRKGIQAINEDELLQILDIALSSSLSIDHAYDDFAANHILTGLEPLGLKELRKKGFEGTNPTLNDPRSSLLARALDGEADLALKGQDGELPAEVVKFMEDGDTLSEGIRKHVSKRFSNLVLVPADKVDLKKTLSSYGMDSMIAAEFRTWFFQAFKVDIPFLELLSKTVTINSLGEMVEKEIEARKEAAAS